MSPPRKVALFGAAGATGQALAPELDRRGIPFRVVGRNHARLEKAFGHLANAEILKADLSQLGSAAAAARDADTIVYCVGLPYPSQHLHPKLMRTTIEAATTMKVERLVLISSVYPYGVPRTAKVAETHPRFPESRKGAYRREQEDLVLDAHRKGQLAGLIVRLPDFYGPFAENSLADLIFRAAIARKTVNWPGPVAGKHEFVFVPDVAPVIVDLASHPECFGEAWNFAGPAEIAVVDFITRVYRACGHSPKYRSVGRTMLSILGWFSPLMRELPEMLYLQETPVILDDSKLIAKLGPVHKTPYDEGIRKTLEWMKKA
jgi:nucleoside-diphosphate-sugar epimerase